MASLLAVPGNNAIDGLVLAVLDDCVMSEAVTVWFGAVLSVTLKTLLPETSGAVAGLLNICCNPMVSHPHTGYAREALERLEFLCVIDFFMSETARYADVVLPGSSFAEKTGTFVNTERRIQVAHRAADPPGEARGDLEILIELSNRLGLKTPHRSAEDVMREIVRVTPSWKGVTYERLEGAGLQYPVPTSDSPGTAFLFDVRFPTADGKASFVPVLGVCFGLQCVREWHGREQTDLRPRAGRCRRRVRGLPANRRRPTVTRTEGLASTLRYQLEPTPQPENTTTPPPCGMKLTAVVRGIETSAGGGCRYIGSAAGASARPASAALIGAAGGDAGALPRSHAAGARGHSANARRTS